MRDAAASGQMVMMRCNLCHRAVNYWAQDLLEIVGPEHEVHVPPFPCSHCRTSDYLNVKCTTPTAVELVSLTVRRPVKQVVKWTWRNEKA